MDEPTNDLDIETQELLEELLMEYSGTLLLVSHDRSFLNNVATSTMVMEGMGEIGEFPGGYDDWVNQRQVKTPGSKPQITSTQEKQKTMKTLTLRKLSFKEERELESLPLKIEKVFFKDVRGNIPTRLSKFMVGDIDGIILAKAALDRILESQSQEFEKSKQCVREALSQSHFIILPL